MAIDTAHYRQIAGHFATGVTVITTAHDGWLHGMTANAVTSVSLNPLLLLVCVDKTANMHEQIAKAGRFGVNILTDEQEDISRTFAATTEPEQGALQGVAYRMGDHGSPILDDVLAYLDCEVVDRCEGGDHTIYIGSVVGGDLVEEGAPLLFFRGGYRRLER
jgi:flavin reductase (DIM6/NTAB) family NADH-FMN oxidoreductase RutF